MALKNNTKMLFALALTMILSGCGDNNGGNGSSEPEDKDSFTAEEQVEAVTNAIDKLKADGTLPELNRDDSLEGPDKDHDGIRDDIEVYLNDQPITTFERERMRGVAKAIQRIQTEEVISKEVAASISKEKIKNYICSIDDSKNEDKISQIVENLKSFTANTNKRYKRLREYQKARVGTVSGLPSEDDCRSLKS